MKEEFRTIPDFPNYLVSNYGYVVNTKTHNILKGNDNGKGYLKVTLYNKHTMKSCKIHRLVAKAFIPNPNNLPEVHHIDEDKTNNSVDNLQWITHIDNVHCSHKPYKVKQLDKNRNLIKVWTNTNEIKQSTNYNIKNIYKCCRQEVLTAYNYI